MTRLAAVDAGGTFTDLIGYDTEKGEWVLSKVLSTPSEPSEAVFNAVERVGWHDAEIARLVHGTTVATNALIEHKGASVALLATEGYKDMLRIQRTSRRGHFDLHWIKSRHFVPRSRCFDIPERVLSDGSVLVPLDESVVRGIIARLRDEGEVRAIAVSYLFSFMNPNHELRTRELIQEVWPEVEVSLSSEVFPRWREYERTSTTVIDAFLKPKLGAYMKELQAKATKHGVREFAVMRSNGGCVSPRHAAGRPSTLVRSGPAGGVNAVAQLSRLLGLGDVFGCDMGGTSFEACLVKDSKLALTTSEEIEFGIPVAIPVVDVRTIGAGGGSIAQIDSAGILRVGPESAGADPGPACYGQGGAEATITDANLVLGRIAPQFLLGGSLKLDVDKGTAAVASLASKLGMTVEEAAKGILDVANANMSQLLRVVSTDLGYDPRDASALVCHGGAGPMHGCDLAATLQIPKVVIPRYPGAFCAVGEIVVETRLDYSRTHRMVLDDLDLDLVNAIFAELEENAAVDFKLEGIEYEPELERSIDLRYVGQNWELSVDLPGGQLTDAVFRDVARRHAEAHDKFYGYSLPAEPLELLTFKLTALGRTVTIPNDAVASNGKISRPPVLGTQPIIFDLNDGPVDTPLFWHEDFAPGFSFEGPALIGQVDATVLVPPAVTAEVDDYRNITITLA